ncbi:hypothetical protein IE5_05570 [Bacillus cereus BAG3X2-2]|nr:hypothetical protein IE5_05570 [Bacillus cereus BAG3X2-2]
MPIYDIRKFNSLAYIFVKMLAVRQLEMDGFNFEDVDWGDLNLLDNEIMSSTDVIEEWGIESSTLRKRINDFPKGSIRKNWHDICCDSIWNALCFRFE